MTLKKISPLDGLVHREVTRQQYEELINSIIQNQTKIQNKIENYFTENLGAGVDFFKGLITISEEHFPPQSHNRFLHDIIVAYCNTRIIEIPIQIEEINRLNEIQERKEKETADRIDKNNKLLEQYVTASIEDLGGKKRELRIIVIAGLAGAVIGGVISSIPSYLQLGRPEFPPINQVELPKVQIATETIPTIKYIIIHDTIQGKTSKKP